MALNVLNNFYILKTETQNIIFNYFKLKNVSNIIRSEQELDAINASYNILRINI